VAGGFLISLDFELLWGMRDKCGVAEYGANILGVRAAVPAMLRLFRRYEVRATWAAVGMLLFDSKKDLRRFLPERRPQYRQADLDPYPYLERIGDDERSDPYHYGLSLAREILAHEGMELASHTFSHYYCLESGQTREQFREDLEASVAAAERVGARPRSLVFPRNQCHPEYLQICAEMGVRAFRGNPGGWMYREATEQEQQSYARRAGQLLDTYVDVTGDGGFQPRREHGVVNLPASRFLRPWQTSRRILEPLRLRRIQRSMTAAAQAGRWFHLWWHPHNFGTNLTGNLAVLDSILQHHAALRERFGMASATMQEAAACAS
jgi:peptidoglycan/xylan/chitin deacetylase (PgdA/CDA1 family)